MRLLPSETEAGDTGPGEIGLGGMRLVCRSSQRRAFRCGTVEGLVGVGAKRRSSMRSRWCARCAYGMSGGGSKREKGGSDAMGRRGKLWEQSSRN